MTENKHIAGLTISGEWRPEYADVFSVEACELLVDLVRRFRPELQSLLEQRRAFQADLDKGELPNFLPETEHIRQGEWKLILWPGSGGWA